MRYVPWTKLRRDEDDNVLGALPQAFQLRPEEEALSVNWIEYFSDPATRIRDSVWAMRKAMGVGKKSNFAIGNVGKIKATCLASGGIRVRIVYEPKDNEPAHSAIRRVPRDDLSILAALADEAFAEMVRKVDVPQQT